MPRTLSEEEFNRVKAQVLASAPPNMDEATFNKWAPAQLSAAVAEAELRPPALEGGVVGRTLSGVGEMLNPVTIATGLGQAIRHPIDTAGTLLQRQFIDQPTKAYEALTQGRGWEALGHGAATLVPVLGPLAADIGEEIGATGDVARGVGRTVGLIAPFGATDVAKGLGRGVVRAGEAVAPGATEATAAVLERAAASKIARLISPRSTANVAKRLGTQAEEIAPQLVTDLAADGAPLSRGGYHAQVRGHLAAAETALDEAADARLAARSHSTQPLIDGLLEKRRALTVEAPEATGISYQTITVGGKPVTTWIKNRGPLGQSVVPGPFRARVAVIDQAISELRQLGPVTRYDPIRLLRQAYDQQAKIVYNPSMTADFLTVKNGAQGAADVTGVLRETLGGWDPATATANAQYSLWRTANDALNAAAELERVRPAVGRQIMTRLIGTLGGSQAGLGGAVAGYAAAPILDAAMASGVTTQLKTIALMKRLADAIRRGDVRTTSGLTQTLWKTVKRTAKQAAPGVGQAVTRATGSQTQTQE